MRVWMFLVLCAVFSTRPAIAQIVASPDNLLEQLVPNSFSITGAAVSNKALYQTDLAYTLNNNSGMNLYLGWQWDAVSLGSCGNPTETRGGLQLMPPASAGMIGGTLPSRIFVPAGGRVAGVVVFNQCDAPNPGSPVATLSAALMMGRSDEWRKMVAMPVVADVPVRQIPGQ